MCAPLPILLAAGSALVAAGGQVYGGLAQRASSRYEAAVATQNRDIELRARDDASARGEIEQMRHWRRVSQQYGDQKVRQAASGVDISFGSASDLLTDVMQIGYEDSSIIAENTTREMRGYEVNAANYTMSARAARSRGNAALVGSAIGAFSTILGGASQVSKIRSDRGSVGI